MLVQRGIARKLKEALVAHIEQVYSSSVGDPKTSVLGPLVSHAHRAKVESYVALAVKEGGTIMCGGCRPKHFEHGSALQNGAFYMPTVIDGLSYTSRTAMEEIFGPVITIHEFDTEEQAIVMANAVEYGLTASVWTRDARKAQRVARQLETGTVWINTFLYFAHGQAFGGRKSSGVGRKGGRHSIDFYTEVKPIVSKL